MAEETAIRCDVCGRREFRDEQDRLPEEWARLKVETRGNSSDEVDLCDACSGPVLDLVVKAKTRHSHLPLPRR